MTRPKEYSREEVLDAATELFWEKGYEGTSMNEMVEQTGLNKHSMYNEFGDKEGLFLDCLEHYSNESTKPLGNILTKKPLGLSNIEAFFNNRVEYATSRKFKGCLLLSSAIEKEILSDKINDKIQKMLTAFEGLLYDCLKAAQEKREIPKKKDCKALASYLYCFLGGLLIVGRRNTDKGALKKLTDVALSAMKN